MSGCSGVVMGIFFFCNTFFSSPPLAITPRSVELVGTNSRVSWYLSNAGKEEFPLNKGSRRVGSKSPVVDAVISGGQKFCVGSVSLASVRREFCAVSLDQAWRGWSARVWAWYFPSVGMLSTCYPAICCGSSSGSWDRDLAGGWLLCSLGETLGKGGATGEVYNIQEGYCYVSLRLKYLTASEFNCIPSCLPSQVVIPEWGELWAALVSYWCDYPSGLVTLSGIPVAAAVPPGRAFDCSGIQASAGEGTVNSSLLTSYFC